MSPLLQVLATVRAEITKPLADTPNAGMIAVNLELTALGTPSVRPGRPNEAAAALSNLFERTLEVGQPTSTHRLPCSS